jgi:hypothetical protein
MFVTWDDHIFCLNKLFRTLLTVSDQWSWNKRPASHISLSVLDIHSCKFHSASSNKLHRILLTAFERRTQLDSSLYLVSASSKQIYISMAIQSIVGLLIVEASHSDTPQSVGLPCTSDQSCKQTSTWWHTTLTRQRPTYYRWYSNPQPLEANCHRPKITVSGHRNRATSKR